MNPTRVKSALLYKTDIKRTPVIKISTLFGPNGDNGFDQTTKISSVYGTCAHFSSMDQYEKSHI